MRDENNTALKELKLMTNLISFDSELSEENLLYLKDCLTDPKYDYYKPEIKLLIAGYQGLLHKKNKAIENAKNNSMLVIKG